MCTLIDDSFTDELERNALPYELVDVVDDRGVEITQIQDILLHEDHCPFDPHLLIRVSLNLLLDLCLATYGFFD